MKSSGISLATVKGMGPGLSSMMVCSPKSFTVHGESHDLFICFASLLAIHSGFNPTSNYTGYLAGSDRVALDTHPYLCFQALEDLGPEQYAQQPCGAWAGKINTTTGVRNI